MAETKLASGEQTKQPVSIERLTCSAFQTGYKAALVDVLKRGLAPKDELAVLMNDGWITLRYLEVVK